MSAAQKAQSPGEAGQSADSKTDAAIVADHGAQHKAEATLIAQFALLGHAVHKLADGGFLVCRWGMARHCPDAAMLAAFLAQIGGAA